MSKSLAEVMREKDMRQGVGSIIFDQTTNQLMKRTESGWEPIKRGVDDVAPPGDRFWNQRAEMITKREWDALRADPAKVLLTEAQVGDYTVLTRWYGVNEHLYETVVFGVGDHWVQWTHLNQRDAWLGHHRIADELAARLGIE
jgi:hypothetical protein